MDNPNSSANKSDSGGVSNKSGIGEVKPAKVKPEGTPDPGSAPDDGPHSPKASSLESQG